MTGMSNSSSPQIAVVGAGHWGPNIVRNLLALAPQSVRWVCDTDPARLDFVRAQAGGACLTTDLEEVLRDPATDAVMLALPPSQHHAAAMRSLTAGKHLFVEKPMALALAQVEQIVRAADQAQRLLMIGLTYRYHPVIDRIGEILRAGAVGRVRAIYSRRANHNDRPRACGVVWMLAPHDVSILRHWLGVLPRQARARLEHGGSGDFNDEASIELLHPGGVGAHLAFSWRGPDKTRRIVIEGEERVLLYDEVAAPAAFAIYRHPSPDRPWNGDFDRLAAALPTLGAPLERVDCAAQFVEPLRRECAHFLDCLRTGGKPLTNGAHAAEVTRIIQAVMLAGETGQEQPIEAEGRT